MPNSIRASSAASSVPSSSRQAGPSKVGGASRFRASQQTGAISPEIVVRAVGIIQRAQPAGMVGHGQAFRREGHLHAPAFRHSRRRRGEVFREVPRMGDLLAGYRAVGLRLGRVVAQPDRVITADPAVVPGDRDDPAVRGGLDRQMLDRPGIEVRRRRPGTVRRRISCGHGAGLSECVLRKRPFHAERPPGQAGRQCVVAAVLRDGHFETPRIKSGAPQWPPQDEECCWFNKFSFILRRG